MPATKSKPMKKCSSPNGKQKKEAEELLDKVGDISDLMRGAKTLFKTDNLRLDMQGLTTDKCYNLQIQTGNTTLATVLLHPNATSLADVKTGLRNSWGDGCIYNVT